MAQPEKYNVIAAFPSERRARDAVKKLSSEGVGGSNVHVLRPKDAGDSDRASELRAEMKDEVAEGFATPGTAFMTPGQWKGAAAGLVIGGLIGLLLGAAGGAVWAFAMDGPLEPILRFAIVAAAFTVMGGTIGVVAGGALKPRLEAEEGPHRDLDDARLAGERDTLVAVHLGNRRVAERAARVLEQSGAERVDAINEDGTPLPPQSEHPRPADPDDRYWRPGQAEG